MTSRRILSTLLFAAVASSAVAQSPKAKPLFRDFIGLNTHTIQFKTDLYKPVTKRLRDYHPFDWDVGAETSFRPPFPFARNQVSWLQVYGDWKKGGYSTDACLMFDVILPPKWADLPKDARSYGLQFARYFGPSGKEKLVESVEIGNEPGKYSDADYRTLFENAARGLREGDPKLLIATCAVYARKSGDYHKNVETMKGLESLYDVLNVHSYPQLEPYPTWRRSFPEDPRLTWIKDVQDVIAWRNANAKGKQVWLTEFGYDSTTKLQDKEGTFSKWVGLTDTQQAQYLVRAFLVLSELDLDRAYIFWFNDDDKPSIHGSSGLTRNYQPKPSFYAVAHLLATLGDYRFARAVVKKPGELYVFEFVGAGKDRITVAWSPTGDGRKSSKAIPIPGRPLRAERMPLKPGPAETVSWAVEESGGIQIEVGESPVFIHWRVR